jgi:regulator of cell morphogenesis and NO signaling
LKQEFPRLEFLTTKVAARHGDHRPALRELYVTFMALRAELDSHMMKEERILFPLCRQLDVAKKLPRCIAAVLAIRST